jgi:uncharacterized protein (TIGR03083 family)
MTLPRNEVSKGLLDELEQLERQVRPLGDAQWTAPTRCDGWTVADVTAHVTGGMADVLAGRLDGLGSPEVTARQVDERRGRSAAELADELASVRTTASVLLSAFDDTAWTATAPGGYDGTLGDGVEALWYDTFLHRDDIRAALGQSSVDGSGLKASASHLATELTKRGWGPATLALRGLPEFPIGDGSGRRVEGDPLEFVLIATGRADPAALGLDATVNVYAD